MKTISLTIPMDFNALNRSAEMLLGLAHDVERPAPSEPSEPPEDHFDSGFEGSIPVSQGGHMIDHLTAPETPEGQFVEGLSFADKLAEIPEGETITFDIHRPDNSVPLSNDPDFQESPHEKTPAEVFGESETARVLAEMEAGPNADEGVELDGDGLPWDHRIHASSKAKLSKAPNCWKRKRNMAPAVIAEVEAELREAMSASPDKPVAPAPAKPELPAEPVVPTDSTVATFPELMAAITAGGIAPAAVLAAVNLQGLASLPLLASRPDLIPAVAKTLGL